MKIRVMGICLLVLTVLGAFALAGCGECEHIYDHVCDTVCNECGFERTVSGHTYDNDCDTHCNKCNGLREVGEHRYSAVCDEDCDACGAKREAAEHTYDNACDGLCNVCNAMREVEDHVYGSACDADCDECGYERTASEHSYSYTCDTECDACGSIREGIEHTFSSNCDTVCNVCGEKTPPAANHSYSSVCDTECDACGEKRDTEAEHTYSGECDTVCDACGERRSVVTEHTYTNGCDIGCNTCGEERENVKHSWTDWKSKGDATCTEDGTKYRRCPICKAEQTDIDKGTATGHYYLASMGYVYNNDGTHTKDGTESKRCYLCNEAADTRTAVGSAGHAFGTNGRCKECGWGAPALGAYMTYESFEEFQKVGQAFSVTGDVNYTVSRVITQVKTGVTYTIVARGKPSDTNIRALKIARATSGNTTGNDTIVDVSPRVISSLTAKHVIEFDIMIGSGNGTNIYLNGRKEKSGGSAVFNQFVWYNDARKSVYIGNYEAVTGVEDDTWFNVALAIDDEARTYSIYVEGELAASGLTYVKSEYYSFSECAVGCYRFTANKGVTAVEFYLDNIAIYNGEYVAE